MNNAIDGRQSDRERGSREVPSPLQATPLNGRFRRCCRETLWEWGARFLRGRLCVCDGMGMKKIGEICDNQVRADAAQWVIHREATNRDVIVSSQLSAMMDLGETAKNENLSPLC